MSSLVTLEKKLKALNADRAKVIAQIHAHLAQLTQTSGAGMPLTLTSSAALGAPTRKTGRAAGFKMSAASRAKMRAAWKKRKAAAAAAKKS